MARDDRAAVLLRDDSVPPIIDWLTSADAASHHSADDRVRGDQALEQMSRVVQSLQRPVQLRDGDRDLSLVINNRGDFVWLHDGKRLPRREIYPLLNDHDIARQFADAVQRGVRSW